MCNYRGHTWYIMTCKPNIFQCVLVNIIELNFVLIMWHAVKPVLKGHLYIREKVSLHDRCPFITGSLTWGRLDTSRKCPLITGCPLIAVSLDRFYCILHRFYVILYSIYRQIWLLQVWNLSLLMAQTNCQTYKRSRYTRADTMTEHQLSLRYDANIFHF